MDILIKNYKMTMMMTMSGDRPNLVFYYRNQ